MHLEGSCHCGAVRFRLESPHPYPYMRCYCSICRKTQGGGGYAINIAGDAPTLEVEGEENISVYRARMANGEQSPAERRFCGKCGSGLWVWDPNWPELLHPFASAIDTGLPPAPQTTHIMLGSKASWTSVEAGSDDRNFNEYPDESIGAWHQRMGLEC
ncbi:MAG: GFA family protein [Proteobacteria bacterium]|nr:GFA family protein [Pseudomonadota bacterium]